ncbi:MAG: UPF0149 family protein, partial [Anaerolineae bacterium]|nr:UPF0149 family protein [Anaerolineae bacterium]
DPRLTDAELDQLAQLLASTGEEAMDLAMLDGFLTGLAVGPEFIDPEEWLALLWDEEGPAFASEAEAEQCIALCLRQYDAIVDALDAPGETLTPIFYESETEGEPSPMASEWCAGFMTALEFWKTQLKVMEKAGKGELLAPMRLFGTEKGLRKLEGA